MQGIDQGQLAALIASQVQAAIAGLTEAPTVEAPIPNDSVGTGTHFASLGFVAVGTGNDPGEGSLIDVPTKAGKVVRVATIQRIDVSPFNGSFGDWAYTYRKLKRGEAS